MTREAYCNEHISKNERTYYAITPFNNYIKLDAATQAEAIEILKDENFERPDWGIDMLGYSDSNKKNEGVVYCLNTKELIPKRLRRY